MPLFLRNDASIAIDHRCCWLCQILATFLWNLESFLHSWKPKWAILKVNLKNSWPVLHFLRETGSFMFNFDKFLLSVFDKFLFFFLFGLWGLCLSCGRGRSWPCSSSHGGTSRYSTSLSNLLVEKIKSFHPFQLLFLFLFDLSYRYYMVASWLFKFLNRWLSFLYVLWSWGFTLQV